MPIHLPPVSRREFLRRTVLAGAGVAVFARVQAASRDTDPNSWALLSDTHIAADRARSARDVNMADHFVTVAAELVSMPRKPAGVFVAGDCAFNSGESGDYETLLDLLHPIREEKYPVHLALGNHDHRERFRAALAVNSRRNRAVMDKEVALIQTKRVNWFVLDSLEATNSTPGLLGEQQLQWLAQTLDANKRKPAIVLAHHNPGSAQNISGLKDTDAFMDIIRPRKQVKAYIFGHTHFWSVQQDPSGIHLVNLPAVAYVFASDAPTGWVLANVERDGIRLELRCTDPSHRLHGEVRELPWRA